MVSERPVRQYEDIVEVRTTGTRRANKLLAIGWMLLYIGNESKGEAKEPGMQPFVKRFTTFVLGRPEGVAVEPPVEEESDGE